MCHMSTRRRAAVPLMLTAFASFALICAAGLSRAADRCPDIAQSVQMLHEGDQYQAASLLFAAARYGCEAEARALLDRGAAIDAKDREGATALAKAAEADKLKVMKLLLERGADPNARAVDGSTPLFYAAKEDRGAAVALLLERGADSNIPGGKGIRPLAAAAYNGSADSVDALLKYGADPNALDDEGKSAMVYAAGHAYAAVVALLASGRSRRQPSLRPWPHRPDVGGGPRCVCWRRRRRGHDQDADRARRCARSQGRPRQDGGRHRPRP